MKNSAAALPLISDANGLISKNVTKIKAEG
jgi:hypothetical protein